MPKQVQSDGASKLPKTRSPGYPAFDLAVAIGKLPALFAAMKRHEISPETAIAAMGLSAKGSTGKLALAAMRSYGLIEGRGMVKLSRRGLDLGVDYKPTDDAWKQAARDAALAPDMHKILWEKYGAELPIDDELRRFLVRENGFNDNTVGQFIADYKKTIAFSELANTPVNEKNGEDDSPDEEGNGVTEALEKTPLKPPAPPAGLKDFPLYTSGARGALYAPSTMKKADFDLFKKQIENYLLVIEATSVVDGDDK